MKTEYQLLDELDEDILHDEDTTSASTLKEGVDDDIPAPFNKWYEIDNPDPEESMVGPILDDMEIVADLVAKEEYFEDLDKDGLAFVSLTDDRNNPVVIVINEDPVPLTPKDIERALTRSYKPFGHDSYDSGYYNEPDPEEDGWRVFTEDADLIEADVRFFSNPKASLDLLNHDLMNEDRDDFEPESGDVIDPVRAQTEGGKLRAAFMKSMEKDYGFVGQANEGNEKDDLRTPKCEFDVDSLYAGMKPGATPIRTFVEAEEVAKRKLTELGYDPSIYTEIKITTRPAVRKGKNPHGPLLRVAIPDNFKKKKNESLEESFIKVNPREAKTICDDIGFAGAVEWDGQGTLYADAHTLRQIIKDAKKYGLNLEDHEAAGLHSDTEESLNEAAEQFVYGAGCDLSDEHLLDMDIESLKDFNLKLVGIQKEENDPFTGTMWIKGTERNIARYLDDYVGGIQINYDWLIPAEDFESTISYDRLMQQGQLTEESEYFTTGSNKDVAVGSVPYNRIKAVCDKLNTMDLVDKWHNQEVDFTVELTYEDFGANMRWKTIICREADGDHHQILSPRDWMNIANGVWDVDTAIQEILNDKYCQFKLAQPVDEDIVKQGSKWVNKGKEGTHGKFDSKEKAREQQKAMFANGYEALAEEDKKYKNWPILFTLKSDEEWADAHEISLDINNRMDAANQLRQKYGDDLADVTIGRNFSELEEGAEDFAIQPTRYRKGVTKEEVNAYAQSHKIPYAVALRRLEYITGPQSNYDRVMDRMPAGK